MNQEGIFSEEAQWLDRNWCQPWKSMALDGDHLSERWLSLIRRIHPLFASSSTTKKNFLFFRTPPRQIFSETDTDLASTTPRVYQFHGPKMETLIQRTLSVYFCRSCIWTRGVVAGERARAVQLQVRG